MSFKEITYIHELLARYNAILHFSKNNEVNGLDKAMVDAVRNILPAFVSCRAAIDELNKKIEMADGELERHHDWPGLEIASEPFEQMDEEEVEALIREALKK